MNYPTREVYLAGPIAGLDHDGARYGWRKEFADLLDTPDLSHILCRSPMRGKEMLKDVGILGIAGFGTPHAMTSESGVMTRDYNDVATTDATVACFLESNGVLSGGTMIEYGMAFTLHKPVITIGPQDDPNVRHIMAHRITGYHVETLEEAAFIVGHLLTPGI